MSTNGVKTCSKCHKTKDLSQFNRRKVSKDGYRGQCRECEHEYYRTYERDRRDTAHLSSLLHKQADNTEKSMTCSDCGTEKPQSAFPLESNGRGYRSYCKSCSKIRWAKYAAQFEGA